MDTQYKKVQAIAKETITYIKSQIRSGFSLKEIRRLFEEKFFTFEPHISRMGSAYGYKKENIYYFQGNELVEL